MQGVLTRKLDFICFMVILVILFFIPTNSHAVPIHYSVQDFPHAVSTPNGSYSVNIFGSVWIESDPVIGPYPTGALETQYVFNINSFAIIFDIPELGESLAYFGNENSQLEISTDHDPQGNLRLYQSLAFCGIGNFEQLHWDDWRIDNDFIGNLPITISIYDNFWGSGAIEGWTAPVVGKNDWTLLGARIVLNQTPVPEPATMLLLGVGLLGLAGFGRKKLIKK